MAIYGDVQDLSLQKLISAITASTRQGNGSILTDFYDRLGKLVGASAPSGNPTNAGRAREFLITVNVLPDGISASAKVVAKSPTGVMSIEGQIDTSILLTKLV